MCALRAPSVPRLSLSLSLSLFFDSVGYGDFFPKKGAAGIEIFTVIYIICGLAVAFPRITSTVTFVSQPLFELIRSSIERRFPPLMIDLDGNGKPDFVVPRSAFTYYIKGLLGPLGLFLVLQVQRAPSLEYSSSGSVQRATCNVQRAPLATLIPLPSLVRQCIFAGVFSVVEPHMDFGTAFYHCLVTATTVGYGDTKIFSYEGRWLAFFHILTSVSGLAALLSDYDVLRERRRKELRAVRQFLGRLNVEMIMSLDIDGEGVDRFEFVVGMLTRLEYVSYEDVAGFIAQFDALDESGDGIITRVELEQYAMKEQERAQANSTHVDKMRSAIDKQDEAARAQEQFREKLTT